MVLLADTFNVCWIAGVDLRRHPGGGHTGMVAVLLAVAATIALAGYLIPSGLAADYAMMSGRPDAMFSDKMATTLSEYARYDADSVDSRVQAAVVGALMLYWEEGPDAFETITPEKALITNTICPLVLYVETFEVVAHGALPDLAGVMHDTLNRADSLLISYSPTWSGTGASGSSTRPQTRPTGLCAQSAPGCTCMTAARSTLTTSRTLGPSIWSPRP